MHNDNQHIKEIGDLAVRALVYELATTPKPGLVDKENNGAHKDMDYPMFKASAMCLRTCFEECAQAGIVERNRIHGEYDSVSYSETLEWKLRKVGLAGENAMFRVTGGVNTHKGLIFSLGIICAACGTLGEYQKVNASKLQMRCREIARRILEINNAPSNTHGNLVYAKTGIYGAKGEALSGFNTAFKVGLPALRNALAGGASGNDAMVIALLSLMTVSEDSNVVYRGGLEGLAFVKEESRRLLKGNLDLDAVRAFDRECIKRNISPGGSADLLAVTAMLHMILE